MMMKLTSEKKGSLHAYLPGFSLAFENINFQVPDEKDSSKTKRILIDANGIVHPGQCCAILGSSGSGKTSLLDILAANTPTKNVTGRVLIGGHELSPKMLREHCGYVMQDDSHLVQLTVRETLTFSALLRLPADMSKEEKLRRVDDVIGELGLMNVADSKVGGGCVRGISGGERRRVSIGVQLLKDPKILLLDEPTTGLDAFMANNIVTTLSKLAKQNKTIIFTIHQPRSDIFPLLDTIMLLSQGRSVYFGARTQIIDYFNSAGFECDIYSNPLDYYIDTVSVDKRSEARMANTTERLEKLMTFYESSDIHKRIKDEINELKQNPVPAEDVFYILPKPGFFSQSKVLLIRQLANLNRSLGVIYDRTTQQVLFAFLLWLFIYRFDNDQTSIQNRAGILYEVVSAPQFIAVIHAVAFFPPTRNLYYREAVDSIYSSFALIVTYFLHLLPTLFVSALAFSTFSYWAIGFYPDIFRFLIYFFVVCLLMLIGEAVGVLFLGLFWDPNLANSTSALTLSIGALLGSGFLRSTETIPEIFKYLGYLTPFKYSAEILYANEFHELELTCEPLFPCDYPSGDDYLAVMYPHALDNQLRNFMVLIAFYVIVIALGTLVYKFNVKKIR